MSDYRQQKLAAGDQAAHDECPTMEPEDSHSHLIAERVMAEFQATHFQPLTKRWSISSSRRQVTEMRPNACIKTRSGTYFAIAVSEAVLRRGQLVIELVRPRGYAAGVSRMHEHEWLISRFVYRGGVVVCSTELADLPVFEEVGSDTSSRATKARSPWRPSAASAHPLLVLDQQLAEENN